MPQELLETGDKLLVAAEELFAARGYHGVSLREITAQAGVNVAAVNYHYSDKESLYLEVFGRRLQQTNARRMANLAEAEARAGGGPVPLSELIEIMARPLLEPGTAAPDYGGSAMRLLGRAIVEPLPFTAATLEREFQPAMTRFGQAVRRHLPALPPRDFLWRFSFIIGALHHALATLHNMRERTSGICPDHDHEGALKNYVRFSVAALTDREMK